MIFSDKGSTCKKVIQVLEKGINQNLGEYGWWAERPSFKSINFSPAFHQIYGRPLSCNRIWSFCCPMSADFGIIVGELRWFLDNPLHYCVAEFPKMYDELSSRQVIFPFTDHQLPNYETIILRFWFRGEKNCCSTIPLRNRPDLTMVIKHILVYRRSSVYWTVCKVKIFRTNASCAFIQSLLVSWTALILHSSALS